MNGIVYSGAYGDRVERNSYWRVDDLAPDAGASLDVTTGENRPTNTYYGASRVYERVTRPVAIALGDEVHVLYGGTFLVRDGASLGEVRFPKAPERNPHSGDDPKERALVKWLTTYAHPIANAKLARYR